MLWIKLMYVVMHVLVCFCIYVSMCVCLSVCTWIPVVYVSMWLIDRPEGISDVLVYHILLYFFEMESLSSKVLVWHSWIPGFNPH